MTKEVFLKSRTLNFTQDLEIIRKNQQDSTDKVLSSKYRFVKKDGRFWGWFKHLLGLETTRSKDVAKALVAFSKRNHALFWEKNTELNRNQFRLIIAKVLDLKLDSKNEIIKSENSSKIIYSYEKYISRSPILYLSTFETPSSLKKQPPPQQQDQTKPPQKPDEPKGDEKKSPIQDQTNQGQQPPPAQDQPKEDAAKPSVPDQTNQGQQPPPAQDQSKGDATLPPVPDQTNQGQQPPPTQDQSKGDVIQPPPSQNQAQEPAQKDQSNPAPAPEDLPPPFIEEEQLTYSLEDITKYFEAVEKIVEEAKKQIDPQEFLKILHEEKDWGMQFIRMLDTCPFNDSTQSIKCLKDISYVGGLLKEEAEIREIYGKINRLRLPVDVKQELYVDQLDALTVNNRPKLFEAIFDLTAKPEYETLWLKVVEGGLTEIAAILVNKGKPEWEYINRDDEENLKECSNTPLHRLARRGDHENTIKIGEIILAKYPELLNKQIKISQNTPLIDAAEKNNKPVYEWLIDKGADKSLLNASGENAATALIKANKRNTMEKIDNRSRILRQRSKEKLKKMSGVHKKNEKPSGQ